MKHSNFIFCVFLAFFSQGIFGLQKESDHFIYYYEASDTSIIDTIATRLEGSYGRITSDLELTINEKIGVHIYPTLQEFHNAIGWPDAPDWLVGVGYTELYVVSPLNPGPAHSYKEIMDNVFIHEFTHVCIAKINTNLPIWLNEGFACYEGGPYYSKASVVSVYNSLGRIPTLDELNSSYDNFANLGGYPFCLTISRFIIENYGMENMVKFIKTPSDYSIFSDLAKSEFQELWMEYVRVNYLGITSAEAQSYSNKIPGFFMVQNYPNPFNSETMIFYRIPLPCNVNVSVFNIAGSILTVLEDCFQEPGNYKLQFIGSNFSSGIYLCRIQAGSFQQIKKMILMK
ncbi:MAG TPA: T9SS type A sorting domain-containing protein [Ignavibacteriaceae bacterium]|nr:T9SS type A sorting domain-containing protein [Ignavibacteriaceae bacterium]